MENLDEKIREALSELDPTDDEAWTKEGKPRLDKVSAELGADVSRELVENALPGFCRDTVSDELVEPEPDIVGESGDPGAEYAEEIIDYRGQLDEIDAAIRALQRSRDEIVAAQDILIKERDDARAKESPVAAYKRFLDSQLEQRKERVRRANELAARGFDVGRGVDDKFARRRHKGRRRAQLEGVGVRDASLATK